MNDINRGIIFEVVNLISTAIKTVLRRKICYEVWREIKISVKYKKYSSFICKKNNRIKPELGFKNC